MTNQYRKNTRFADVLQGVLNKGLQHWIKDDLTPETSGEIYEYILKSVNEIFSKSSQNLTEASRTWIAQQLFLTIKIRNTSIIVEDDAGYFISPFKVFEDVSIKNLPTDELRIVGGLFSDCDFACEIATELKKRTWAR